MVFRTGRDCGVAVICAEALVGDLAADLGAGLAEDLAEDSAQVGTATAAVARTIAIIQHFMATTR